MTMLTGITGRTVDCGVRVLLLAAVLMAACDKVPLLAPTNSTISLSSGTRTLPNGGSTELTAMVLESSGTAVHDGTAVRFTTTLGTVTPVEAQTRNGVATATFTAGNEAGIAEVRATSGGAGAGTTGGTGGGTTTTTAGNVVQITIGAAAVNTIAVTVSPSTVPANGGTVTVIANALDANGNRLAGVPVTFTTTSGSLSSSVATTDSSGEARVQLTTSRAATVTAAAGSKTATATVTAAARNSLTLAVSPTDPAVGQPVTLTVTPTIGENNSPPRVTVDWGDGTQQDIGTVSAARGVTHTYTASGSYTITATATGDGDTFTTSTAVTVSPRAGVRITASPTSGEIGDTFTFTITPPSGGQTDEVTVNINDERIVPLGAITTATPVTHVFTTAGAKVVRVTERSRDGSTSTATVAVNVTP
jgi:hypothetical protein